MVSLQYAFHHLFQGVTQTKQIYGSFQYACHQIFQCVTQTEKIHRLWAIISLYALQRALYRLLQCATSTARLKRAKLRPLVNAHQSLDTIPRAKPSLSALMHYSLTNNKVRKSFSHPFHYKKHNHTMNSLDTDSVQKSAFICTYCTA